MEFVSRLVLINNDTPEEDEIQFRHKQCHMDPQTHRIHRIETADRNQTNQISITRNEERNKNR